jgi:hypothetical protein
MQVDHNRSAIDQNFAERAKLFVPADETSGYLPIQQIPNSWHRRLQRDHINPAVGSFQVEAGRRLHPIGSI